MYNEDYMYAVDRSDEYLAHYGIKGMRWGVRKAIERGDQRALARQYRKAQKKLAKLERRANSGEKYASRAKKLAAGAAVAGGLAGLGTEGISRGLVQAGTYGAKGISAARRALLGTGASKYAQKVGAAGFNAANAVSGWGNKTGLSLDGKRTEFYRNHYADVLAKKKAAIPKSGSVAVATQKYMNTEAKAARKIHDSQTHISNNTLARAGAAAVGAGLLGAAGYNAYRAATTQRAAKKAAQFRAEMNKAFKGTQYANASNSPSPKKKARRRR